tara:strand:+ start:406 stop:585 length:180 start_codon:yes stop_codon:yes gene_type:complete
MMRKDIETIKYCVWVDTESHGYVILSVNGRTEWKTKRIAEKHAREWKAENMRDSWAEEI